MSVQRILFILATAGILALGSFKGYQIIEENIEYAKVKADYARATDWRKRLASWESLPSIESDNTIAKWINAGKEMFTKWTKGNESDKLMAKNIALEKLSMSNSRILGLGLLGYLLFVFLIFFKRPDFRKFMALGVLSAAVVCLIIGVFTPMLDISALTKNSEMRVFGLQWKYDGDMYFFYQNKSIFQLVLILLDQNNYLVGVAIGLFSITIPAIKLLCSYIKALKPELEHPTINFVIKHLAKWSMADVFVVAIILAFLSFKNMDSQIEMQSYTFPGLYFFFAFCILSIASGYFMNKKDSSISE